MSSKPLLITLSAGLLSFAISLKASDPEPYLQAVRLVQEQRWSEALMQIDTLTASYPDNPKVLNLKGLALIGKGDPARARSAFQHALHSNPRFSPALKNLAILECNENLPDAAADTLSALASSPGDAVLNAYGTLAGLTRGDRSKIASYFDLAGDAISSMPVELEAKLGFLLGSHEFYKEAQRAFADVMSRGFKSPGIRYNLGLAEYLAGENAEAIRALEELRRSGPNSESLNLLAQAYVKAEQPQKAIDVLKEAISADPVNESNYLDLANLCIEHGLDPQAEEVVQAGIGRLPQSSKLYFQAGLISSLSRRFDEANRNFEKAMLLDPSGDLPKAAVDLLQIEQSRLPDAVARLRKQLKADPKSALLWYFLGVALNREGPGEGGQPQSAEAEHAFQTAMKLDPSLPFPCLELAKIYVHSGRAAAAIPLLRQAMDSPSTNRSATYQLAMVYKATNQPDLAKELLSKIRAAGVQGRTAESFQPEPRAN